MRIEVEPDALRAAASEVGRARLAVESLAVARHLDAAAAAVRGGLLAAAAAGVADGWCRERARLSNEFGRFAHVLRESAAAYQSVDRAAVTIGGDPWR